MDSQIYNIYIEYGMHVFYVTKILVQKLILSDWERRVSV